MLLFQLRFNIIFLFTQRYRLGSAVGLVIRAGLCEPGSRHSITGTGNTYTVSGTHTALCSVCRRGTFLGCKAEES